MPSRKVPEPVRWAMARSSCRTYVQWSGFGRARPATVPFDRSAATDRAKRLLEILVRLIMQNALMRCGGILVCLLFMVVMAAAPALADDLQPAAPVSAAVAPDATASG